MRTQRSAKASGPRLDVWRAVTDNDRGSRRGVRLAERWYALGLHRMQHRVCAIDVGPDDLTLVTRVVAAQQEIGLLATYRWTAGADALSLRPSVEPDAEWPVPTRYVYPQENGNPVDARWLELRASEGYGLRIERQPQFDFAAGRWTGESLSCRTERGFAVDVQLVAWAGGAGSFGAQPGHPDRGGLEGSAWLRCGVPSTVMDVSWLAGGVGAHQRGPASAGVDGAPAYVRAVGYFLVADGHSGGSWAVRWRGTAVCG